MLHCWCCCSTSCHQKMSTGRYNRSHSQRTVSAYASERSDNGVSQCISSSTKLHSKCNVFQQIWNPELGGVAIAVQEGEFSWPPCCSYFRRRHCTEVLQNVLNQNNWTTLAKRLTAGWVGSRYRVFWFLSSMANFVILTLIVSTFVVL